MAGTLPTCRCEDERAPYLHVGVGVGMGMPAAPFNFLETTCTRGVEIVSKKLK